MAFLAAVEAALGSVAEVSLRPPLEVTPSPAEAAPVSAVVAVAGALGVFDLHFLVHEVLLVHAKLYARERK